MHSAPLPLCSFQGSRRDATPSLSILYVSNGGGPCQPLSYPARKVINKAEPRMRRGDSSGIALTNAEALSGTLCSLS